jgi:signal transduction histidine kinase
MQSIRFRLAVSYSLALTATMVVFGAAVYWERRESGTREAERALAEDQQLEASSALHVLYEQARYTPVVVASPTYGSARDSTYGLVGDVRGFLDGMGTYLFISDEENRLLYVSPKARDLDPRQLVKVQQMLDRYPVQFDSGAVRLADNGPPFHYTIMPVDVDSAGPHVMALVVAGPPRLDVGELQQLLVSMLLLGPLILVASAMLGYWLAGHALQPVEVMIEELEAIQDGRSLHRRLAVPPGRDELSRLADTLNAMLGRVEQSFVALRRFTADASHELKTPLMVLRAGVERSLTHPLTPDDIVASLDETLSQINQMSELVNNLLTLARADEGRANLVLAEADVGALVSDAGETAEILGAERGVTVAVSVPEHRVTLPVDAARIRHLLMNLTTNAIKYTPPGGEVTMELTDHPGELQLTVRDTGIGIAPGDLPHVFERFWRADLARTRTGEHPGTGLGLAIAKWIVEAHGGTIGVQSRPGRGTVFTVTFPTPDTEAAAQTVEGDR